MPGHVVAQQDDDIRIKRIGVIDNRLDMLQRHPGVAGMQVGNDGDLELEIRGPSRRLEVVARNAKPQQGLDAEPISRRSSAEGAQTRNETKESSARNQEWLIGASGF